MSPNDAPTLHFHDDADLFREAISFTAARTGFAAGLIEKDYFCTVLLAHLAALDEPHVFKGGTCLAKVHGRFYRLSEDLDFAVPMPLMATRMERSRQFALLKKALAGLRRAQSMSARCHTVLPAGVVVRVNPPTRPGVASHASEMWVIGRFAERTQLSRQN